MHELSIAEALIQIADRAAADAGADAVTAAHIRVGALSGVLPDALIFAFDIAAQGTRLEGARLEVETVPIRVYCLHCDTVAALDSVQILCCPLCGQPTGDIRAGRELELISLEVADDDHDTAPAGDDPAGDFK